MDRKWLWAYALVLAKGSGACSAASHFAISCFTFGLPHAVLAALQGLSAASEGFPGAR